MTKSTKEKNSAATVRITGTSFRGVKDGMTKSQIGAELTTRGNMLAALTTHEHAKIEGMEFSDVMFALEAAATEVERGDLSRLERTLTAQFITLDTLFQVLAKKSAIQNSFGGLETMMKLALKAQSQARSTAEAISLLKNPQPYIGQANIAQNQQVFNGKTAGAGNFQNAPNELLETSHAERMDIGAPAATGSPHPHMATMGAVNRATDG